MKINSLSEKISLIHLFIPKWFLYSTDDSEDVICVNVKDVEIKEVEPKMLEVCKRYHLILRKPIKSVKVNETCESMKELRNEQANNKTKIRSYL